MNPAWRALSIPWASAGHGAGLGLTPSLPHGALLHAVSPHGASPHAGSSRCISGTTQSPGDRATPPHPAPWLSSLEHVICPSRDFIFLELLPHHYVSALCSWPEPQMPRRSLHASHGGFSWLHKDLKQSPAFHSCQSFSLPEGV